MQLAAQVRPHVVADAASALMAKGADVDRGDDHFLALARVGLGQHAAVEVHHHTAAGPAEGRVACQARPLIRGHNVHRVLRGPRAIEERPPVHGRRRAPRIHVRRDAHDHLRAVERDLADRFGEEPVVADRDAEPADLRLDDGKGIGRVIGEVVGTCVQLPRDPRVHLAVLRQHTLGPDEHSRVEDHVRMCLVDFEKRAGLDIAAVLASQSGVPLGVLVGDLDRQALLQLLDAVVNRSRVCKLGERQQANVEERFVADDGLLRNLAHALGSRGDFIP